MASLRDLLEHPAPAAEIGRCKVDPVSAVAISAVVDRGDALAWFSGALGELHAALAAQGIAPTGHPGGVYSSALFCDARGQCTVFIPCDADARCIGRVSPLVVPGAEFATIVHAGPHSSIDLAYGALGAYVTRHALAVEGPLRERYLVGPNDTPDAAAWRTEIGWPIFQTG